ncbi:MAG: twin-arginine translocation signal domain-containing protein, partial [Thermoanaerobaculia bacterium]
MCDESETSRESGHVDRRSLLKTSAAAAALAVIGRPGGVALAAPLTGA